MSVTFQSHDAPRTEQEVDDGDGQMVVDLVSTLPSVNLSNETAATLVALFDLPFERTRLEGQLDQESLDRAITKGLHIINGEDVSAFVVEPTVVIGAMRVRSNSDGVTQIGRGATFVELGCTDERIVRRARDLLDLFTRARAGGYSVGWG